MRPQATQVQQPAKTSSLSVVPKSELFVLLTFLRGCVERTFLTIDASGQDLTRTCGSIVVITGLAIQLLVHAWKVPSQVYLEMGVIHRAHYQRYDASAHETQWQPKML